MRRLDEGRFTRSNRSNRSNTRLAPRNPSGVKAVHADPLTQPKETQLNVPRPHVVFL